MVYHVVESDVFGGYEHNGLMFQWGQTVGAFLLFPEHRYSFQYVSLQQAMRKRKKKERERKKAAYVFHSLLNALSLSE